MTRPQKGEQFKETWLRIITKAWSEPAFRAELIANPNAVLKKYDVEIPDGVIYEVKEDELKGKRYLVLPPKPDQDPSLTIDTFGRDAQSGDPGF